MTDYIRCDRHCEGSTMYPDGRMTGVVSGSYTRRVTLATLGFGDGRTIGASVQRGFSLDP